jgi:putative aldouronate transport system permease protein
VRESVTVAEDQQSVLPGLNKKAVKKSRKKTFAGIMRNKWLYLMMIPGILYFIIFKYLPMGGIIIAFQDYQPFLGIANSPWVGLKHFERLFTEPTFFMLLGNTLLLFALNLFIFFPIPIFLALMLNEVKNKYFKSGVQTIIYIPHFMSWVIIVSICYVFLAQDGGAINALIAGMGGEKIPFLTDGTWSRIIYILQIIWKEMGWSTIIYLAAVTAVDPGLYEAAKMDGASRLRQIWHITLPAIRPIIIIMLILKIGQTLDLGFEHVYLLLNSINREAMDIFDTYVYTAGMKNGQLSFSTAVGLFKGIVGLILVVGANRLAKKFGEEGLY